MFKNPFSFEGRIRRLEYGLSYIIYIFAMVGIVLIVDIFQTPSLGLTIFPIALIPALWFLLAQGAKRCHDRGNSGVWQIIPFYYLWMIFADGEIGDNEYGENPKGIYWDDTEDTMEEYEGDDKVTESSKNRMTNLDRLLEAENVNNSIIEIDNFIGDLCNYSSEMEVLTIPQQKFYINQNLEREVNNGGFWQYFMNSSGEFAHETLLSLKEIGAVKTAEVLQKAIDLFPEGNVPKDREIRQDLVNQIDPNKTIWYEIDERFMNYQEDLNDLNIKFVALHKDFF